MADFSGKENLKAEMDKHIPYMMRKCVCIHVHVCAGACGERGQKSLFSVCLNCSPPI